MSKKEKKVLEIGEHILYEYREVILLESIMNIDCDWLFALTRNGKPDCSLLGKGESMMGRKSVIVLD